MPDVSHECSECTFVSSVENVYLGPDIRRKITREPTYLGAYVWPGCSWHLHCYAMLCDGCGDVVVDYPHGYLRGGRLYFSCYGCPEAERLGRTFKTIPVEDKKVYEREKIPTSEHAKNARSVKGFREVFSGDGVTILARDETPKDQGSNTKNTGPSSRLRSALLRWALIVLAFLVFLVIFIKTSLR